MFIKINVGLFKYDLMDYHAILCVPVDADGKKIRKRYLEIARRLHPDSNALTSAEKQQAHKLLSTFVNPAYEHLGKETSHTEHLIVLSQMGKRLLRESAELELSTDLAKKLLTETNYDHAYKTAIAKIATTQYQLLEKSTEIISQVSELNLVYLMRSAATGSTSSELSSQFPTNSGKARSNTETLPPVPEDSPVDQYVRRAQTLINNNQLSRAKVELQDALKLEPKNSLCHSLIALVYLRQNQIKMAKIHFDNALKLDPTNEIALTWKPKIEKALGQQSSGSRVTPPHDDETNQPDKSGGGGLFGGLFGGNKK